MVITQSEQISIVSYFIVHGTLIKEGLSVGDSIFVPSVEGLSMTYEATNGGCLTTPKQWHLTNNLISYYLPWLLSKSGAYGQDSVASIVDGLADYEDLYLVELGSTNSKSSYFDLQDAIFIVNNNPTFAD